VNAEPAFADNLIELVEPYLTSVVLLAGAAGQESAIMNGEDQCVEELLISAIEWNVDENSVRGVRHRCELEARDRAVPLLPGRFLRGTFLHARGTGAEVTEVAFPCRGAYRPPVC
jgi:hypothetical protein